MLDFGNNFLLGDQRDTFRNTRSFLWSLSQLLHQLGIKPTIDVMLVRRIVIGLERGDQGAQPRREDD